MYISQKRKKKQKNIHHCDGGANGSVCTTTMQRLNPQTVIKSIKPSPEI